MYLYYIISYYYKNNIIYRNILTIVAMQSNIFSTVSSDYLPINLWYISTLLIYLTLIS